MSAPREVLVIRQSAYGDILHALPALAAARSALPGTRVILLVRERFGPVARLAPFVDEVWHRAERRVDLAVDMQGLMRSAWLAWRSGARVVAGLGFRDVREKPAALFYGRRVRVSAAHVVDRNVQLLAGALGTPLAVDRGYRARFLVTDDPAVRAFLAGVPEPRVIVHPASSQAGKHLDPREWKPVLDLLAARGFSAILSCGPGEEGVLAPWREAAPRAAVAPVFPLASLGALAAGCRLMLAADTGILHLADGLGIPCLSWFSLWPPERNGPYFSPSLVFWRRPPDVAEVERWLDEAGP